MLGWDGDTTLPSHAAATPASCPTAPTTHLHPRRASCCLLPRCSPLARRSAPPPPPAQPPLLLPQQPGPASPSPGGQRPLCPSPAAAASGEEHGAGCHRQTHGAVSTGGTWRGGGGGDALRPRTHFIPSHLYWISWISGLRELVYPIRLHCRGRLPAPGLAARGHGLLCGVWRGDQARVGGSQGHQLLPAAQQPPQNPHHCQGGCWLLWAHRSHRGAHAAPSRPPPSCKHLGPWALAPGASPAPRCAGDGGTGNDPPAMAVGQGEVPVGKGLCQLPVSPKTIPAPGPSHHWALGEPEAARPFRKFVPWWGPACPPPNHISASQQPLSSPSQGKVSAPCFWRGVLQLSPPLSS